MKKIVMNKHAAYRAGNRYVSSTMYGGVKRSYIDQFIAGEFLLVNQEYIDFIKVINTWIKTPAAAWLFDTTITKADG